MPSRACDSAIKHLIPWEEQKILCSIREWSHVASNLGVFMRPLEFSPLLDTSLVAIAILCITTYRAMQKYALPTP